MDPPLGLLGQAPHPAFRADRHDLYAVVQINVLMDYLARIDGLEQQVQAPKAAWPGNHRPRGQYP